uniref:testis-expressed protein 26 n=1 Tax=Monopterus albus TaxID=43700 RepID=UPI0009B474E3|nr:testis-expressed protein 26-like [Monopterus albus]
METKEGKQWWDPYETSHRRHFVYWPNSSAEILLRPLSTSFVDSCSLSGPFGSTVYKKDFCWKPACKAECVRTGTASGQRKNNPHPSQSFMIWRMPRDATQSPEYVKSTWKGSPSEGALHKALTGQYCSTYRCDFMGMPQGYNHINNSEGRLAPLHGGHHAPLSTDTEMRDSCRQPKQKPGLLGSHSHYSTSADPSVAFCGIVPTVVRRHVNTRQKRSDLTTYERFFGKVSVIKSSLPQELQQLPRILPEDKEAVKSVLS